jgi:hypothetical protein
MATAALSATIEVVKGAGAANVNIIAIGAKFRDFST